jgi:hypothetical protein
MYTFQISTNRYRGSYKNLSANDPAMINQRQKIIQNTIRIDSSSYTMNLAGLNVYQSPSSEYQVVEQARTNYVVPPNSNWNQMSDRAKPSRQYVKTGSNGSNSLKGTKVSYKPGSMSPGGIGVDIKHNSYERYLNRIKGKGLLKRGQITKSSEEKMTGGKHVRFATVNNCACSSENEKMMYANNMAEFNAAMYNIRYSFHLGDKVLVRKNNHDNVKYKGTIISINDNKYLIQFDDGCIQEIDIYKYAMIPNLKIGEKCTQSDPANLSELLQSSDICQKEKLLEAGIFI